MGADLTLSLSPSLSFHLHLRLHLRLRLSLSHSHTPFSSSAAAWHHPGVERLQEGVLLTLILTLTPTLTRCGAASRRTAANPDPDPDPNLNQVWSGFKKECCSDADNFQVVLPSPRATLLHSEYTRHPPASSRPHPRTPPPPTSAAYLHRTPT